MFERYNEAARRALFFARFAISERGGVVIAPAHLVHGILRADAQAILRFANAGTTVDTVVQQLEQLDPPKDALPASHEIPFGEDTKAALKRAATEADDLHDREIGPEHLMLGVMVTTSGEAARVLRAIGVEIDAVRRALHARPATGPGDPQPVAAAGTAGVVIRSAVPTFLVADVASTAGWYTANLGFQIAGTMPKEEPYAYASVQRGPAEIMLLALANYEKPDLRARRPTGLWDAYVRLAGVQALFQTLKEQPFIQKNLAQQPYGDWEFEVRDPNGYVLVFGGEY